MGWILFIGTVFYFIMYILPIFNSWPLGRCNFYIYIYFFILGDRSISVRKMLRWKLLFFFQQLDKQLFIWILCLLWTQSRKVQIVRLTTWYRLCVFTEMHLLSQPLCREASGGRLYPVLMWPLSHLLPCDLCPCCWCHHGARRLAVCGVSHLPQTPVAEFVCCKL